jgi:hypothetical protein
VEGFLYAGAEGLLQGAELDLEGVVAGRGVVKAVQADGEEFQLVQEGILHGPVFPEGQVMLKVAVVAAEGGNKSSKFRVQSSKLELPGNSPSCHSERSAAE